MLTCPECGRTNVSVYEEDAGVDDLGFPVVVTRLHCENCGQTEEAKSMTAAHLRLVERWGGSGPQPELQ